MTNTSATGGFLASVPAFGLDQSDGFIAGLDLGYLDGSFPLNGEDLEDFFQELVVGITALPGALVRPRWQPEPANIPQEGVSWAAIGITSRKADTFAAEIHHGNGEGYNELQRHEELDVLASFYGPNADYNAELLRDGVQVAQNRETLQRAGMGLVQTGDLTHAPALIKEKWQTRVDVPITIRRIIRRQFPVLNLLTLQMTLHTQRDPSGPVIDTPI